MLKPTGRSGIETTGLHHGLFVAANPFVSIRANRTPPMTSLGAKKHKVALVFLNFLAVSFATRHPRVRAPVIDQAQLRSNREPPALSWIGPGCLMLDPASAIKCRFPHHGDAGRGCALSLIDLSRNEKSTGKMPVDFRVLRFTAMLSGTPERDF